MRTITLDINGMHCDNCVTQLTRKLKSAVGVLGVKVDLLSRTARVEQDEQAGDVNDLVAAVTEAGFQVDGFRTADAHP